MGKPHHELDAAQARFALLQRCRQACASVLDTETLFPMFGMPLQLPAA